MSDVLRPPESKKPKATSKLASGAHVFGKKPGPEEPVGGVYIPAPEEKVGMTGVVHALREAQRPIFAGDPRLLEAFDLRLEYIAGNTYVPGAGMQVARMGVLTFLMQGLPPPVLWDDPALAKVLGKTACVDTAGRLWCNAHFFRACYDEDLRLGTMAAMSAPLMLHEYMHVLLKHTQRMRNMPHGIANQAQDVVINPLVKALFSPSTAFSPLFEQAWGNRAEDKRFANQSEETIAKIMMAEESKRLQELGVIHIKKLILQDGPVSKQTVIRAEKGETKEIDTLTATVMTTPFGQLVSHDMQCRTLVIDEIDNQRKPPDPSQCQGQPKEPDWWDPPPPPSGGPGEGEDNDADADQDANGQPQQGQGKGKPRKGGVFQPRSNDTDNPFNGDQHVIDQEELRKTLEAAGHGDFAKKIGMDEFSEQRVDGIIEESMYKAENERLQVGANKYPGDRCLDYAKEAVKASARYRVTWQRFLREWCQGYGSGIEHSMDARNIIEYVDPEDMGFDTGEEIRVGDALLTKPEGGIAVVVDTSGSVSSQHLLRFLAFILSMKAYRDESAPDLHMYSADTDVRGGLVEITEDNVQELIERGVEMGGRGGTDFLTPIHQVMNYARENDITYEGMLYVTDLGCAVPAREQLPEHMPPLLFAAITEDWEAYAAFETECVKQGYAIIDIPVETGSTIDVDLNSAEQEFASKAKAPAP